MKIERGLYLIFAFILMAVLVYATTVSDDVSTFTGDIIAPTFNGSWNGSLNNGSGISIVGRKINHSDTSEIANIDNSGTNVIQDLTFDSFGHPLTATSTDLGAHTVDIDTLASTAQHATNISDWHGGVNVSNETVTAYIDLLNVTQQAWVEAQNYITNAVSNLINYFTRTQIYNFFESNKTSLNKSLNIYIADINSTNRKYTDDSNISMTAYVDGQDHTDHGDGANCAVGEISLGVDANGAVQGCYEPTEADITDLSHTVDTVIDTDTMDIVNQSMFDNATINRSIDLSGYSTGVHTVDTTIDSDTLDIVNQTMLGIALNLLDNITLVQLFGYFDTNITSANTSIKSYIDAQDHTDDQSLFETITGDSGSTTANSVTDSFKIGGGNNITCVVSGDAVICSINESYSQGAHTVDTDTNIIWTKLNLTDLGLANINTSGSINATVIDTDALYINEVAVVSGVHTTDTDTNIIWTKTNTSDYLRDNSYLTNANSTIIAELMQNSTINRSIDLSGYSTGVHTVDTDTNINNCTGLNSCANIVYSNNNTLTYDTEWDTQGEVETIWGVTLSTDTERTTGLAAQDACSEITGCVVNANKSLLDLNQFADSGNVYQDDIGADCGAGNFVKGVDDDGTLDCSTPTDTDTISTTAQHFDNITSYIGVENVSLIKIGNTSWVITTVTDQWANLDTDSTDDYATSDFNTDIAAYDTLYKKANLTIDYPNLDTDSTDDLDLPALDNTTIIRTANTTWWTTQYESEIPNCAGGEFTTGDGTDLSCSTPTDTTYTADETNITLDGTVFRLLVVDLAELDNSVSAFISNAVSDLVNYFTKAQIFTHIGNNITSNNASVNARVYEGEVTGIWTNLVVGNDALDDQYYDSESDLTTLLDNNYLAIGTAYSNFQIGNVSNSTPWTQLHTYPTGCTNQFVRSIDDTLTCATVDSADIATDAVKDDEVDYSIVTLADFTNDPKFTSNATDVNFNNLTVTNTNTTMGSFVIGLFNSSCSGFRFGTTGGWMLSCEP